MKKKLIFIALFLCIVVLLISPMFTHNGIVQNIERSSDMKIHLDVVNSAVGQPISYFGQVILKYILRPFANSDNLDTIYLWFNFGILIAVAISLYYVVKKLAGNQSAMLVIPVALFSTTGILALFTYGVIFNVINMYLILPFAILFSVYWLTGKGWWYSLPAIGLFALFSMSHYSALYLPFVIILALVGYVVYAVMNREYKYVGKVVLFGSLVGLLNVVLSSLFLDNRFVFASSVPVNVVATTLNTFAVSLSALKLWGYHLSIATGILLGISVWGMIVWGKKAKWDKYNKSFVFILACFAIALISALFRMTIADFNRIALDLATITALITACLLGLFMQVNKSRYVQVMIYAIIAVGVVPNIIEWVRW